MNQTQPNFNLDSKHKVSSEKSPLITISRTFNAPVDRVFDSWSNADLIKQWWGPKHYSTPSVKIDFRVGGKYTFAMQGPDKKVMWSSGDYEEIVPNKKIVSTDYFSDKDGVLVSAKSVGMPGVWGDKLYITVDFESVGKDETKIVISHEGIPKEMHDECVTGWSSTIDKLQKLVERN